MLEKHSYIEYRMITELRTCARTHTHDTNVHYQCLWSHNWEIMTWAETKSQMLNQLSYTSAHKHFLKKRFIYLFIREREAETQAEGDLIPDPRITPWVEGRCSTTEPPRYPSKHFLKKDFYLRENEYEGGGKWGLGEAEGERKAGSPLSREPDAGLDPRTLGSWPKLKAET